jgi:hypothetical protein
MFYTLEPKNIKRKRYTEDDLKNAYEKGFEAGIMSAGPPKTEPEETESIPSNN